MFNDILRRSILKPQLFVSTRGPNIKTFPIDKHGNGVVCHCLKQSILMKPCYNFTFLEITSSNPRSRELPFLKIDHLMGENRVFLLSQFLNCIAFLIKKFKIENLNLKNSEPNRIPYCIIEPTGAL